MVHLEPPGLGARGLPGAHWQQTNRCTSYWASIVNKAIKAASPRGCPIRQHAHSPFASVHPAKNLFRFNLIESTVSIQFNRPILDSPHRLRNARTLSIMHSWQQACTAGSKHTAETIMQAGVRYVQLAWRIYSWHDACTAGSKHVPLAAGSTAGSKYVPPLAASMFNWHTQLVTRSHSRAGTAG